MFKPNLLIKLIIIFFRTVQTFELREISDFFKYKYDENCTYMNLRPDGLILTNKSEGLIFFENKVWKTDPLQIKDPKFEYLSNVYPQLDAYDLIDSIFTLLDKDLRYCFIIQESTYYLYFTQQNKQTLKHHPFINQIYLYKDDLSSLFTSSSNYTNLFITPIFCTLILPVQNNIYNLFFFGYFTKYTNCEFELVYRKINPNRSNSIINRRPAFKLIKECEIFKQDQDYNDQECRFLASIELSTNSSTQNFVFLGQRERLYYNSNESYSNFFKKMFTTELLYGSIWNCTEISFKDYNIIKFLIIPMFLMFTISFVFLNRLFDTKEEDKFIKQFTKERHINKVYQEIRADYIKRILSDS